MDIQALVASSGGQYTFGLTNNVPGVAALRDKLYASVVAIPWADSQVLKTVFAHTDDGAVWSPNYAIKAAAWRTRTEATVFDADDLLTGIPPWLADIEHAVAWNMLTDWWRDNVMPVLIGNVKNQAVLLNQAVDDAAFWNALYKTAVAVANAPAAVTGAASSVAGSIFSGLVPIFIMGGALFLAFIYSRSQYRKGD